MRRRLVLVASGVVLIAAVIVGVRLASGSDGNQAAANAGLPPAIATVTRTTLVETKTVSGTLGYGEPVPIRATVGGILTWIAPIGSTVERGDPLFKVDQRPVVALFGSLPLYRTLRVGRTGGDVRQLERNLAALGYAGITVDDTYTAATAAAVRAWHTRPGLPETGAVAPGQVVFTPGPIRIAEHTARVGDTVGREPSDVLSYTGTTRRVTVDLDVADGALAVKDRTVTVTVPGAGTVKGKVSRVGTVITAAGSASDQGTATDAASSAAPAARIEVTVTISDQKALGPLDAAPVNVDFVSGKRAGVLAVPVVALLALAKGGFGVQVVAGARTRIIPVKTGMFAAGLVEISGTGIAVGTRVGVPK